MSEKCYLHRISHEGNIAYSLMNKNFLTLGWGKYAETDILEEARKDDKTTGFRAYTEKWGDGNNRSRWNMWYFGRIAKKDLIVVPLYGGLFSIYEACEPAKSIIELEKEVPELAGAWSDNRIVWKDHRIFDETDGRVIDLGFYIKVKPIVQEVPRKYITGQLSSRMKTRMCDADITDLMNEVRVAIEVGKNDGPISVYEQSVEILAENLKKQIINLLDDHKFEELIRWYLVKCGADYSRIPAKNEPGKKAGADADIVAEFKNLKHMVYIQAKHHEGETSDWAVHQINEYFTQMVETDPDYSYAKWVISTCDNYSEDAVKTAKENNVRLINGVEFARMLLDIGLLRLDEAFSYWGIRREAFNQWSE